MHLAVAAELARIATMFVRAMGRAACRAAATCALCRRYPDWPFVPASERSLTRDLPGP